MKITPNEVKKIESGFQYVLHRPYRAVYGLGEKFDGANQKGRYVRACVREKCFEQGEYTYLSMPFFMTPDGFGVYVDTYVEVDFDFTQEDRIVIVFAAGSRGEQADIYLFEGSLKEILRQFRECTGMPRIFPKWALGSWMSSNRWHTQAEVEEQLRLTEELGFPHNVFVIEPWSDHSTHYLWQGSRCPLKPGDGRPDYAEMDFSQSSDWRDPAAMIREMHQKGLRLLLWVVPMYECEANYKGKCNEEQRRIGNAYVVENRECVFNADGTPYEIPHTWCIGSMIPDFTNERACDDWFRHFEYLKEIGVDGFKTDGGEFVHDHSVRFSDGTTGVEGQNAYCEQYTRAFADFVGEQGIVFSRAGGQRSPAFSVIWAGDQESTWPEFRGILSAGLSAGLSGINCWGFDIAGFSGYLPTKELYLRAVQFAAFAPVMQWHSDPVSNDRCDFTRAWNINDRSPWNIAAFHKDKKLLPLVREQFYLHYNLLPYLYALMLEASATGLPTLRHLALEFPEDEKVFGIEDEFMVGGSLLVAPVLDDYIDRREVYLPQGEWYDLYTGKRARGGKRCVRLSKRHLPVYMRAGQCVPHNLSGGILCSPVGNGLDGYKELTFLVCGAGQYIFTDDLGNHIVLEWTKENYSVSENAKGTPFRVIHLEGNKLL